MVTDILLFAVLRQGRLRHYYQPNAEQITAILDNTLADIENTTDPERRALLIQLAYQIGVEEAIPLLLSSGGEVPVSWRAIERLRSQL